MRNIKPNTVVRSIQDDNDRIVESVVGDTVMLDTGEQTTPSDFVENGGEQFKIIREPKPIEYDLTDIVTYAVNVLEHRFDGTKPVSLGEDIAYAALRAAINKPLTGYQQELMSRHMRDGKVCP